MSAQEQNRKRKREEKAKATVGQLTSGIKNKQVRSEQYGKLRHKAKVRLPLSVSYTFFRFTIRPYASVICAAFIALNTSASSMRAWHDRLCSFVISLGDGQMRLEYGRRSLRRPCGAEGEDCKAEEAPGGAAQSRAAGGGGPQAPGPKGEVSSRPPSLPQQPPLQAAPSLSSCLISHMSACQVYTYQV